MSDIFKRGTSLNGDVRIFACNTTELVNEAQKIHDTFPVATAALGRALTAGVIMSAASLKSDTDALTIQIKGDGPLGSIVVCTDNESNVRGYVANPYVDLPLNAIGKLDVGRAVGPGILNIIRDLGLKEPYVGQIPLVSGEIAEDLTEYYSKSEQIPTAIGLGVLVDRDYSVKAAGGFMVQMMPGSTDETAHILEKNLEKIGSVTKLIDEGKTAEDIIFMLADGLDFVIENCDRVPHYKCTCSKGRMEKALISIGKDEINSIIEEQGEAELSCQFCNNKYTFSKAELTKILKTNG